MVFHIRFIDTKRLIRRHTLRWRTDNTMIRWKTTKKNNSSQHIKILHRQKKEPHYKKGMNSSDPEGYAVQKQTDRQTNRGSNFLLFEIFITHLLIYETFRFNYAWRATLTIFGFNWIHSKIIEILPKEKLLWSLWTTLNFTHTFASK